MNSGPVTFQTPMPLEAADRSGWLLRVVPLSAEAVVRDVEALTYLRRTGPEQRVARLLAPLPLQDFMTDVLHRDLRHFPGTIVDPMTLFSWDALNAFLVEHEPRWPRVNLARDGQPLPPKRFLESHQTSTGYDTTRLRTADLLDHLQAGATLVINAIDEMIGTIRCLAEDMEYAFSVPVQVNAYVSYGRRPGFGTHWDDHDVFVVQVAGTKEWRVYEPSVDKPDGDATPFWHGVLQQGDVLYLPRGWWHLVSARDEPSLHLTSSLPFARGRDVVRWVGSEVWKGAVFEHDVPAPEDGPALARMSGELRSVLDAGPHPAHLQAFAAYSRARARPRPHIDLPAMLQTGAYSGDLSGRVSSRLSRPAPLLTQHAHAHLYACNKVFTFAAAALPFLRDLLTAEDMLLSDLLACQHDQGERGRACTLVRELVVEDLVSVSH